jgi:hypothetical protein
MCQLNNGGFWGAWGTAATSAESTCHDLCCRLTPAAAQLPLRCAPETAASKGGLQATLQRWRPSCCISTVPSLARIAAMCRALLQSSRSSPPPLIFGAAPVVKQRGVQHSAPAWQGFNSRGRSPWQRLSGSWCAAANLLSIKDRCELRVCAVDGRRHVCACWAMPVECVCRAAALALALC